MATQNTATQDSNQAARREWQVFAYHGFARIVARKHGLVVPELPESLSDEDLDMRMQMVRDLAHLPPG